MSKAWDKAWEAYPEHHYYDDDEFDTNQDFREVYVEGYEESRRDTLDEVLSWLKMNCWVSNGEDGEKKVVININKFKEDMNCQ